MRLKGAILYGLNIYDLLITIIGVRVYGLVESNPAMAYFANHALLELFVIKVIAMWFICEYLGKHKMPLVSFLLDAMIVLYAIMGILNTLVVIQEAI